MRFESRRRSRERSPRPSRPWITSWPSRCPRPTSCSFGRASRTRFIATCRGSSRIKGSMCAVWRVRTIASKPCSGILSGDRMALVDQVKRGGVVTMWTLFTWSTRAMRSPDKIPEHGFEAIVRTLQTAHIEPLIRDDPRQVAIKRVRLARPNEQLVGRGHLDGHDVIHGREGLGDLSRLRRRDSNRMRMLVDQRADRVKVPRGDRLPVVDQNDVLRHPLDLVQDVGRHEDVPALTGEPGDRPENLHAADRIGPGQRLVEDQNLRVVRERLRELRPLPHPAAVPAERPILRGAQADELERRRRLRPCVADREAIEAQQGLDELGGGHPAVHLVLFRAVADAALHRDVVPGILPEEPDIALVGPQLADQELEQRALPRPVRSDEPRNPRAERRRESVQPEDLPVPLREVERLDDAAHPDTTSTALMRRYVARAATTVAARRIPSASGQSIGPPLTPYAARATAR